MLDGVFNHCGLGFAPFCMRWKGKGVAVLQLVLLRRAVSLRYMTFGEKWAYMPKLNMQNEACAEYFLDVGGIGSGKRRWTAGGWMFRRGLSGVLRQFRRAVKKTNPNAIMIAECWDDSREWCTIGDMFDGTDALCPFRRNLEILRRKRWSLAEFDAGVNRAMMLIRRRFRTRCGTSCRATIRRVLTRCGGRRRQQCGGVLPDDASRRAGHLLWR